MTWTTKKFTVSQEYCRCFHASVSCGGLVYMHGGLHQYPCNDPPLSDVVAFDPMSSSFSQLICKNSGPTRSHHTAVSLNEQTLCFVGGWDGKRRTTDVWLLDIIELEWKLCKQGSQSKPPAGLSSHTCTLISTSEMIITGREGGVRMQRRFGSVYKLKVDLNKRTCIYEELPYHISSRAGHTCCPLAKNVESTKASLVIIGGRDSKDSDRLPLTAGSYNNDLGLLLHQAVKSDQVSSINPKAIRNHTSIPAGDLALVHGGEMFGKSRDNILADLLIHDYSATRWWKIEIDANHLRRMGHTSAWVHNHIYILGGVENQCGMATNVIIEISIPGS